jgi:hypothetical protein
LVTGKKIQSRVFFSLLAPVPFFESRCGFTKEAEDCCRENGIACKEDENWLEE